MKVGSGLRYIQTARFMIALTRYRTGITGPNHILVPIETGKLIYD